MSVEDCQKSIDPTIDPKKCIKPDVVQVPMKSDEFKNISKMLGITECVRNSSEAMLGWNVWGIKAGPQASNNYSIGCDQVSVLVNEYKAYSEQVNCIISSTVKCVRTNIEGKNIVKITNGPGARIEGAIRIKQGIALKVIETQNISSEQKTQITQATSDFIKSFFNVLKDNASTGFATAGSEQAQKSFSKVSSDITDKKYSTDIQQSVTSSITQVFASNIIEIVNYGQITANKEGVAIDIDQNIAIDAVINKILKSAVSTISDQESVKKFISDITDVQKSKTIAEKKRMGIMAILVGLLFVFIGWKVYQNKSALLNPVTRYAAIIRIAMYLVVGIILLFLIYYALSKIPFIAGLL